MHPRHRLALMLACGLLLIAGAWGYRRFWVDLPIGQGPTGPAVPRDGFQRVWTDRPVLLLGLGDGVTEGDAVAYSRSYFCRVARNPQDESAPMRGICLANVLPNLRVYNRALAGATSIHLIDKQARLLPKQVREVLGLVLLTTGGNDLALCGEPTVVADPIAGFNQRLEALLPLLDQKFPGGFMVFLGNLLDPTDGVGDFENTGLPTIPEGLFRLHQLNDAIARFAERHDHVYLVDLHSAFLGHGVHCAKFWAPHYRESDPYHWYAENLEQPNERGADAARRLFLLEIARVLGPG